MNRVKRFSFLFLVIQIGSCSFDSCGFMWIELVRTIILMIHLARIASLRTAVEFCAEAADGSAIRLLSEANIFRSKMGLTPFGVRII